MISELCLSDLQGRVEVVLRHDGHIEAPNWHRDGFLLVNGGGRLFRVPLQAPVLELVDTGPLGRLNNDHGVSPDGAWIAFSDHTEDARSIIYVMPVAGGPPRRVTPIGPSWWHGWSPDGARIAYAGARDGGPVLMYTCAIDGSDERLLTPGFDHVDGPDYTPDGGWVWFNGERDGRVNLWRVHPDGTDPERMTDGDTVDWFPHPSPCGAHVLWLAYPPGTKGHPADLPVTLNLMPATGEPGRVVQAFRGGQGSINVPCWAPDSQRFAFVRYPEA